MSQAPRGLLLAVQGPSTPPIEVPPDRTSVLGSAADRADVVVEGLADAHCAIGRLARGGWALRDLGSGQGSRVNGRSVEQTRISHGDLIELGPVALRVIDPSLEPVRPPAAAPPAREPERRAPAAPARELPERVGGFRLLRPLGRGATGEVVLAVQESLDRKVALKLLSPELAADAAFVARFQSEARRAAALSHPNVVVVYDVGEADGRHFLAMEYMERGSLESRLAREGRLHWREVLRVLHDAAHALAFAEERGLVHRDVKPDNLMQSAAGATKLADLGLAHPVSKPGAPAGTPHFVSPEQARGERADHKSDLYSLGATAHRLLTGGTPFAGSTTREILREVLSAPPPSVRASAPDVPAALDELVQRLLAKSPAERPASARALLADLDRVRAGEPAAAPASGVRRPLALALAALLLAAAAWALVAALGRRAGDAPAPAAPGRAESSSTRESAREGNAGPAAARAAAATAPEQPARPPLPPAADDEGLRALEREAERELAALSELPPGPERDAARAELLERYRGTTAAGREAVRTPGERAAPDPLAEGRALVVAELERALDAEPTPGAAARRLLAFAPPVGLRDDAPLSRELQRLGRELVERAVARARAARDAGEAAAQRGDFAALGRALEQARRELDADGLAAALSEGGPSPSLLDADLSPALALAEELARARASAPEREREHARAVRSADAALVERALGAGAGLAAELRVLRFGAARARLEELAPRVAREEARSAALALAAELAAAERVLSALERELAAGGWRRRTVADPRGSRLAPREVTAWSQDGLLVADGAGVELLPWSALGARPDAVDALFRARLTREYGPDELEGIAAALRLSAALASADALGPALARTLEERAGAAPAEPPARGRLLELWAPAREWSALAGSAGRAEREVAAAEGVADALAAAQGDAWELAADLLEATLSAHPHSLLAWILR